MSKSIKTLSECSKLEDRSLKWYKRKINQKCSRKCSNVVKNGNIYKSLKKGKEIEMGLFKVPNLCGYEHKSKSKSKKTKGIKKKRKTKGIKKKRKKKY